MKIKSGSEYKHSLECQTQRWHSRNFLLLPSFLVCLLPGWAVARLKPRHLPSPGHTFPSSDLPAIPEADVCPKNGFKCEGRREGSEMELTRSLVWLEEEGKDSHPGTGISLRRGNGCLATAGVHLSGWLAVLGLESAICSPLIFFFLSHFPDSDSTSSSASS